MVALDCAIEAPLRHPATPGWLAVFYYFLVKEARISLWQPTRFVRFVKSVPTSTDACRIVTDQGEAFVKALDTPCVD